MSTSATRRAGVLADPVFLRLWAGATASGIATWALPFVLGLAVAQGELAATALGVLLAARTVGFLLAVPVAGLVADRHSRRGVVLVSGLAAALATPVVAATLDGPLLVGLLGAAVVGAGQGACRPAFQALVRDVVEAPRRQAANAAMTLSVRASILIGPVVAAALSRVLPVWGVVVITGVLWLITALAPAWQARAPQPPARAADTGAPLWRTAASDLAEGVAEARRHRWFLSGLGALVGVIFLGYSATSVALPLISRDRFGGDALLAVSATAYAGGALAGALLIARWRPVNRGWWALFGLSLYSTVPLTLALSPWPTLIVLAYVAGGIGIEVFNVPWFTATQREVAPDKLARVSSLDFLISFGLAPLGLAALAPAMEAWGQTPVLLGCAAISMIGPLAAAFTPSSRYFGDTNEEA